MRLFRLIPAFLFFCLRSLISQEPSEVQIDNLKPIVDHQSLLIHDCVNIIKGTFCCQETDLKLPGPRTMELKRSTSSENNQYTTLKKNWNLDCFAWVSLQRLGQKELLHSFCPSNRLIYFSQGEGTLVTTTRDIKEGTKKYTLYQNSDCYEGWCHPIYGGGKKHRKNITYTVFDEKPEAPKTLCITDGSGKKLHFRSNDTFYYQKSRFITTIDEELLLPLKQIRYPNGHLDIFTENKEQGRKQTPTFSSIYFNTANGEHLGFFKFYNVLNRTAIQASNGRKIIYSFFEDENTNFKYLSYVANYAPGEKHPFYSTQYIYQEIPGSSIQKIKKILYPDNRFLKIEYSPISKKGKVTSLEDQTGMLYSFLYDKKNDNEGVTTVFDKKGNQVTYHYKQNRIQRVVQALNHKESIITEFTWADNSSETPGVLERKQVLFSKNPKAALTQDYLYDSKGNLIKETLKGQLTGKTPSSSYSISYKYIDNGNAKNLIDTIKTNRTETKVLYTPNTDLVTAVYIKGDTFQKRQFYVYNEAHLLIKKIQDDGLGGTLDDYTGVTYRKITEITPKKGLPSVIIEKFWNRETEKEEPSLKLELNYNFDGNILSKKTYTFIDSDWVLAKEISSEYDTLGRCILEIDPEGYSKAYSYDVHGNIVKETTLNHEREYTYDSYNRRTKTTHTGFAIPQLTEFFSYNHFGSKTSEIDIYGNKNCYFYDSLNRLIKIKNSLDSILTFTYDTLHNKTSETNGCGHKTLLEYNIRGDLISKTSPKGSTEKRIYTLDGLLEEEQYPDGLQVHYNYDAFGRITEKEWLDKGTSLKKITHKYNSFFLIATTENDEQTTTYHYNHKGQLIEERMGEKVTTYRYDNLGNKIATRHFANKTSFVEEQKQYDRLGRIIFSCQTDETSRIFHETSYLYDAEGQIVCKKEGQALTHHTYDALGNLILTVDPQGHETSIHHDFKGNVTTTYPNGTKFIQTKDALGQVILEQFFNIDGDLVQKQAYAYDANGNKIQEEFFLLKEDKKIINHFTFDPENHLITQVEALGSEKERLSTWTYDTMGRKTSHIKPSTTLNFLYDRLGRVIQKNSTNISYSYKYDLFGRLTEIKNDLTGKKTELSYDFYNNVIQETLETGFIIKKTFDYLNRPINLILPNGSFIDYEYTGAFLTAVKRLGEKTYRHHYAYNDRGRLITEILPLGGQQISHSYDLSSRWLTSSHTHLCQRAVGYDPVYNLIGIEIKDPFLEETISFEYDSLKQLTKEKNHTYQHDSLYNRTQKDDDHYTLNDLNQLNGQSNTNYTYDLNGNLSEIVSEGKRDRLSYDGLDRLILFEQGDKKTYYEYDGLNRRLIKRSDKEEFFLYDGKKDIGSYEDGVLKTLRILGCGIDSSEIHGTVAIEQRGKVYLPLHNPFGHLAMLLDAETGKPVEYYRTTAFGECSFYNEEGKSKNEALSPWIISSKRFDMETGFTLYGLRYYSPDIGRWITPDPAGFIDGANLYTFVKNNPLMYVDLYGLNTVDGAINGVFDAGPELAMIGIGTAAVVFAPEIVAVGVTYTFSAYGAYCACDLAYTTSRYMMNNIAEQGVKQGLLQTGTDVKEYLSNLSSEDVARTSVALLLTRQARNCGKKFTAQMAQIGQKTEHASQKMETLGTKILLSGGIAEKGKILDNGTYSLTTKGNGCQSMRAALVIEETLSSSGAMTSKFKLNASEALDAGILFLGKDYSQIGNGIFRSADGLRQFRMDTNSLLGKHNPWMPHVHLEMFHHDNKFPHVNNHVTFYD